MSKRTLRRLVERVELEVEVELDPGLGEETRPRSVVIFGASVFRFWCRAFLCLRWCLLGVEGEDDSEQRREGFKGGGS